MVHFPNTLIVGAAALGLVTFSIITGARGQAPSLLPAAPPPLFGDASRLQPAADTRDYLGNGRAPSSSANSGFNNQKPPSAQPIYSLKHFQDTPTYESTGGPAQTAAGDFNGDGIVDLVVGDFGPILAIHLGNGDGTFQPYIKLDVGDLDEFGDPPAHWAVATGDLNGDGKDDIVVDGLETAKVTVLLSNGDGSFRKSVRLPNVVSFGLRLADVNRDRKLDIVVAEFGIDGEDGHVNVYLGNGDGTFQSKRAFTVGVHPDQVAIGDLNHDGKADIVAVNSGDNDGVFQGSVSVLLGNGDGTFRPKKDYLVGLHPQCVTMADVNGDGRLDVIASNLYANTVSVLIGNGDGTLAPRVDWPIGHSPADVVAADVNNDGKIDLVTVNDGVNSSVLLGNGDGTFRPHQEWGGSGRTFGIAVADFNRDGKPDIALTNTFGGSISIQIGNGDGSFRAYRESLAGIGPSSIAPIDLNHDGKLDLAATLQCSDGGCDNPGYVRTLRGVGNGRFVLTNESYDAGGVATTNGYARSVVVGDFNNDGTPDLAWLAGDLVVLLRSSSGTELRRTTLPIPTGFGAQVVAGDFNHDGKLDLATANLGDSANALMSVYLGKGDGTFKARVDYPGPQFAGSGTALAVGDLNGDCKQDLVITDEFDDQVSVYLGKGDGTFRPHIDSLVYPQLQGITPAGVAIADFNDDGKEDIIVSGHFTNGVFLLLGKGDGTFQTPVGYVAGGGPIGVSVADLNKDGSLDVVTANNVDGTLGVLYGNPDGTFQPVEFHNSGADGLQTVLADFTGDGWKDIAVATGFSDIALLRNKRVK